MWQSYSQLGLISSLSLMQLLHLMRQPCSPLPSQRLFTLDSSTEFQTLNSEDKWRIWGCGKSEPKLRSFSTPISKTASLFRLITSTNPNLLSQWTLFPSSESHLEDTTSSNNHINLTSAPASPYSVEPMNSGLILCEGSSIFTGT